MLTVVSKHHVNMEPSRLIRTDTQMLEMVLTRRQTVDLFLGVFFTEE